MSRLIKDFNGNEATEFIKFLVGTDSITSVIRSASSSEEKSTSMILKGGINFYQVPVKHQVPNFISGTLTLPTKKQWIREELAGTFIELNLTELFEYEKTLKNSAIDKMSLYQADNKSHYLVFTNTMGEELSTPIMKSTSILKNSKVESFTGKLDQVNFVSAEMTDSQMDEIASYKNNDVFVFNLDKDNNISLYKDLTGVEMEGQKLFITKGYISGIKTPKVLKSGTKYSRLSVSTGSLENNLRLWKVTINSWKFQVEHNFITFDY